MHTATHIFIIAEDGAVRQQLYAGSFCIRINVLTAAFYVLWFVEQMVHFKQAAFKCTGVDDGSGFGIISVGAKWCLSLVTGHELNIFEKHVEYFECIDMKWWLRKWD